MNFKTTLQARHLEAATKVHESTMNTEEKKKVAREQVAFLNIFAARLWHDLHNSNTFIDLLREKITRKLLKVKARYKKHIFIAFKLSKKKLLSMGVSRSPSISRTSVSQLWT